MGSAKPVYSHVVEHNWLPYLTEVLECLGCTNMIYICIVVVGTLHCVSSSLLTLNVIGYCAGDTTKIDIVS